MTPNIVLIRHAQALHNATNNRAQDYTISDPPLSDIGVQQCGSLKESLRARFGDILSDQRAVKVAVIASPMRRTLQTAQLSLDWFLETSGTKITASADWQENSDNPCDTGSPVSQVADEYPLVDFGSVDKIWPDKTSTAAQRYAYSRDAILKRGQRCLESLKQRPEDLIFVVTHSAFLRLGVVGHWFFNSDYRIFEFRDSANSDPSNVDLQQDEATIEGGLGLSWPETVILGSELPIVDQEAAAEPLASPEIPVVA